MYNSTRLNIIFNPHPRICLSILETEEGREGETSMRERNIDWLPPVGAPTRTQTCNLGLCPDRGLNPHLFGEWEDTPTK